MWPYYALKNMQLRTNAVQEWVIRQYVLWAGVGKDVPNSKDLLLTRKCCPSSYEWLAGGRGCDSGWWLWHCCTICSMDDSRIIWCCKAFRFVLTLGEFVEALSGLWIKLTWWWSCGGTFFGCLTCWMTFCAGFFGGGGDDGVEADLGLQTWWFLVVVCWCESTFVGVSCVVNYLGRQTSLDVGSTILCSLWGAVWGEEVTNVLGWSIIFGTQGYPLFKWNTKDLGIHW